MQQILILLAGVAAIAWVNWYFFMAPKSARVATVLASGAQQVNITVEGGYSPAFIRAKRGQPLQLVFDRKEKSPCSDEIVLGDFGIRRFLKPFEKTVIEVTPPSAGTYEFACGMSMLRGQIEVEE